MTDHDRFKLMLKDLGLNYFNLAEITGNTYGSIKVMMMKDKALPTWAKTMLYVYEKWKS